MTKSHSVKMSRRLPYRLCAIDLDDTLLAPDKSVSKENILAVKRLQDAGLKVVIASGREHGSCLYYQKMLSLDGPVVSCQGALVKHPLDDKVLYEESLDVKLVEEILNHAVDFETTVIFSCSAGTFTGHQNKWTDMYEKLTSQKLRLIENWSDHYEKRPYKIQWLDEAERMVLHRPRIKPEILDQTYWFAYEQIHIEFLSPHANKGNGLASVADHYGIDQKEVVCFGDAENDISMLKWAGQSIAMSHARPGVRQAAKLVAPEGPPESSLARAVDLLFARDGE